MHWKGLNIYLFSWVSSILRLFVVFIYIHLLKKEDIILSGIFGRLSYSVIQNEGELVSVPSCLELKRFTGQYDVAVVYLCGCRLEDPGTWNICTLVRLVFAVCGVFSGCRTILYVINM